MVTYGVMAFTSSWCFEEEVSVEVLRNVPPEQDIMGIAATIGGSLRELERKEFEWSTLGSEKREHKKMLTRTPLLAGASFKAEEVMEKHFKISHKVS